MIDAPTGAAAAIARQSDTQFLEVLLGFAGHAPAWAPALPWSVEREGATLRLRLNRVRDELLYDPANREVIMACGAVLENLRIAARHFGRELLVTPWPNGVEDPVVAAMALGDEQDPRHEDEALFGVMARAAVPADPSTRARGVSPALVAVLRHAARCEGGWLDMVVDDVRRELVGDLECEAVTIGDAERGARCMLALRLGREPSLPQPVEVATGGAPALAHLLSALGASVRCANAWSADRAAMARESTVTAPMLAILGSAADGPPGWLEAGAALQRVLLHAKVQGLTATLLNEPLHHPLLRDALRTVLFTGGAPQAIVRFDFAEGDQEPGHTRPIWRSRTAA